MIINQPGNDGVALQVNHPTCGLSTLAHGSVPAVPDQKGVNHTIGIVKRVDPSIHQSQIAIGGILLEGSPNAERAGRQCSSQERRAKEIAP